MVQANPAHTGPLGHTFLSRRPAYWFDREGNGATNPGQTAYQAQCGFTSTHPVQRV